MRLPRSTWTARLTIHSRLALLTATAVAAAVLIAAGTIWWLLQGALFDQTDAKLVERWPVIVTANAINSVADEMTISVSIMDADPIGYQRLDKSGNLLELIPPGETVPLAIVELSLIDNDDAGLVLWTSQSDDTNYRILSQLDPSSDELIRLVYPLDSVNDTLTKMAWLLLVTSLVGVAVAAGLGWLISRAGLRPLTNLSEAAETVAATGDLGHRIPATGGDDEVAKLAQSINTMLSALEQARRDQKELVENAGHELRTPLAVLRNDIGLLVKAEQQPGRQLTAADRQDLLANLEAEAAALTDLVGELVALARGEDEPEPLVETDLDSLITAAAGRTARLNPAVAVNITGQAGQGYVRPATLERAVANLVRNALQVSPAGSAVTIEASRSPDRLRLLVLDRGPGLAEHDLPHLFDRFYRGQSARRRPGSGLGLAIVAQAAAAHNGQVRAANRTGGGALFELSLPLVEPSEDQAARDADERRSD